MAARSAKRNEFLFDVFVTAIEGGVNYWARVSDYRCKGHDNDGAFSAKLNPAEPDDFDAQVVDIDVISKGIGLFVKWMGTPPVFGPDHYFHQFVAANRTNGDDGDYDAEVADMIVQFGLFGEVVYG